MVISKWGGRRWRLNSPLCYALATSCSEIAVRSTIHVRTYTASGGITEALRSTTSANKATYQTAEDVSRTGNFSDNYDTSAMHWLINEPWLVHYQAKLNSYGLTLYARPTNVIVSLIEKSLADELICRRFTFRSVVKPRTTEISNEHWRCLTTFDVK